MCPKESAVLIVDSVARNRKLLEGMLRTEGYRIIEAGDAEEAFSVLSEEIVDLVVIDLMIPGVSGLEFCRQLKADRKTRLIPVLILTDLQGIETEVAGIDSGADEFLIRPLHPAIVRARIASMLRHKVAIDSLEEAESILFALAQAIEHRDKETGSHCERLAWISVIIGNYLGLPKTDLQTLYRGSFLHDIGKVSIPDAILFKPGRLNREEWAVMRTHATKGEEICTAVKSIAPVLPIIRNHHEKWDGSGYPDGLKGEQIPMLARILQIADIYDALTTPRPYKPALNREDAVNILEQEADRGWRDPELVGLFRRIHCETVDIAAAESMRTSLDRIIQALDRSEFESADWGLIYEMKKIGSPNSVGV